MVDATNPKRTIENPEREKACGIVPSLPAGFATGPFIRAHRLVVDDGHTLRSGHFEQRADACNLRPHRATAVKMHRDVRTAGSRVVLHRLVGIPGANGP